VFTANITTLNMEWLLNKINQYLQLFWSRSCYSTTVPSAQTYLEWFVWPNCRCKAEHQTLKMKTTVDKHSF